MAKKDKKEVKNEKRFFKELKSELKKVTWPTFKELVNDTSAVISIVLIVAIVVFVLDVCFENLNNFGINGVKTLVSSTEENVETENETEGDESNNSDIKVDSAEVENTEVENTEGEGVNEEVPVETPAESETVNEENQ